MLLGGIHIINGFLIKVLLELQSKNSSNPAGTCLSFRVNVSFKSKFTFIQSLEV